MDSYDASSGSDWFRKHGKTAFALLFIVVLAGVFRIAFNYEDAVNDGNYRYAGNDDYYHLRVVQHVTTEGEHLQVDPLLNYPSPGSNPRPPLYDWHIAIMGRIGSLVTGEDPARASAYALEWGSALWGALTVIPVWLIGRAVYSNRAGLWAGFLVAASPAHIQRSGFGLGDHDGFILFFLCLGAYFLIRALELTPGDRAYGSWTSLGGLAQGLGGYADAHRTGLAYALLAGMSWTAIAFMWEGFPYVTAIYAVYFFFQLVGNHLRRRDSTGDVLVMLGIMAPITLLSLPNFWTVGNVGATVTSNMYIVAGLLVLTLCLAFTRDVPSILVLPGMVLLALLGWAVLTFVVPDIGRQLFSANGYFQQSKLYSTIAEAQRTDLGVFVFSIGFMTFFLALIGFVWALIRYQKTKSRDQLYLVAWGLVSIYMAFAALRFVFNAAPVFAVLAGWMVDKIVGWMNWRERLRDFQSLRHESWTRAIRSTLGAKQMAGAAFLVFTLLVPNLWFSFDAGLPGEARARFRDHYKGNEFLANQTGVFGQGFLGREWIDIYAWMNDQDRRPFNADPASSPGPDVPCAQRPAHMAWWDYGFWEVALGCHPTVADNFQNGVEIAGRAIAAQSEKEAIEWNIIRVVEGSWRQNGLTYPPAVAAKFQALNGTQLPAHLTVAVYDSFQKTLAAQLPNATAAAEFYMDVAEATGFYVGYFLVDHRMMPLDFENTPFIDSGSIFYAPVFLANRNPDNYVQTVYVDQQNREYEVQTYGTDAQGNSFQSDEGRIVGPDGKRYIFGGSSLIRTSEDGKRIDYTHNDGQGAPLLDPRQGSPIKLKFKPAFYQTMFYRAYVGGDGSAPASGQNYHDEFYQGIETGGNMLKHFRLVKSTQVQGIILKVNLLKFYLGAPLEGRVALGDGQPVGGVQVTAFDDLGIPHDSTFTDADGRYRLLLPFSQRDDSGRLPDISVRVVRGGSEISNLSFPVTEAQAMRREPLARSGDITVHSGNLQVLAYIDRDRTGSYNESIDEPAVGAEVVWDAQTQTAGSDGKASFQNVLPGLGTLSGRLEGYQPSSQSVEVPPNGTADVKLPFTATAVLVNGTVRDQNGSVVANLPVTIVAQNPNVDYTRNETTITTDMNGNFSRGVQPGGRYVVRVDTTREEAGLAVTYRGSSDEFLVSVGDAPKQVEVRVTRS